MRQWNRMGTAGNCPSITWHCKKAETEKMTSVETWESKTFLLGGSWNGGFMHTQQARQIGSQYKASASLKTFFFWQNLYASWACWVIYGAIKHTLNQSLLGKKKCHVLKKGPRARFLNPRSDVARQMVIGNLGDVTWTQSVNLDMIAFNVPWIQRNVYPINYY